MKKFIINENIARFGGQLRTEAEPAKCATLRVLLAEEEMKLGACWEELERAELHIARGQELIRKQEDLLKRLNGDGNASSGAEALLASLVQTQALWVMHRERILRQLDQGQI